MKKYGMSQKGSRPGIWKKRLPSCLLHHPRILFSGSKSWLPALAVLLTSRDPPRPGPPRQQSPGQPQVGSQHWSRSEISHPASQAEPGPGPPFHTPGPGGLAEGGPAATSSEVLGDSEGGGDRRLPAGRGRSNLRPSQSHSGPHPTQASGRGQAETQAPSTPS